VLLGLWDDIRRLNPWIKIGGQVFAAVCLLIEGVGLRCANGLLATIGVRVQHILSPSTLDSLGWAQAPAPLFADWIVIAVSSVLVIGLIVFCCNATNLMDGLDGCAVA
jgi:UDP-N-acetylmuramyl pentapeptide phosphotransferase/UDP-N-acetylglucosamine-1-phosphate transferase